MLVVDDLSVNRRILDEQLSNWGLQVTTVSSGPVALARLKDAAQRENPYELAVVDFQMPDMDGSELASRIKQAPLVANTAIIVLSSVDIDTNTKTFEDLAVAAILSKPVRGATLRHELKRVLAPASGTPLPRLAEPRLPHVQTRRPPSASNPSGAVRVLVAEDNVVNRKILENMMARIDYHADFARRRSRGVRGLPGARLRSRAYGYLDAHDGRRRSDQGHSRVRGSKDAAPHADRCSDCPRDGGRS